MKENSNMLTYLKKYGNLSFSSEPFNDIDNLILAMLSYIDFENIVLKGENITIEEASREYFKHNSAKDIKKKYFVTRQAINLLEQLAKYSRFKNLVLSNYIYEVNDSSQFGALTINIDKKTIYISFEGTDGNLSGWEEDFKLAYCFPTVAQKKAIEYINKTVKFKNRKVIVGGHSKGGNLALVASTFCKRRIKFKIIKVYNNDGPGLDKKEFNSRKFKKIVTKIQNIIPIDSFIGTMFYQAGNCLVVKTTTKGLFSHDAFTWCCIDNQFVKAKQSSTSIRRKKALADWLETLNIEERRHLSEVIFDVFRRAKIKELKDIEINKIANIRKILKEVKNINKESKKKILEIIKQLI